LQPLLSRFLKAAPPNEPLSPRAIYCHLGRIVHLIGRRIDERREEVSHAQKHIAAGLTLVLGVGGGLVTASAASAGSEPSVQRLTSAQASTSSVADRHRPGLSADGRWTLYQSNRATVTMNLEQASNGRIYGSARSGGNTGTVKQGLVDGNTIFFVIEWWGGPRGRYDGRLGPDRRLSGTTYDLAHPTSQASWFTRSTF
jgi:hypothetical protein